MENVLFTPLKIGNLALKNRIVFPPLTTGYEEDYRPSKRSIHFYQRVAEGGAGLIIIGDLSASKNYSMNPHFYDDSFIASNRQLVNAVHDAGAKICAQVYHGEYNPEQLDAIFAEAGIAAVKQKMHEDLHDYCNKITQAEIKTIQQRIVDAAVRADQCGFDMIQLHGDRIVGMFTSPILNQRTDEYGGSLENRARFALELVQMIRKELPNKPLEYKMVMIRTSPPLGKGGPTIEEGKIMTGWLEEAGIDSFHVSLANHGFIGDTIPAMGTVPHGCFLDLAKEISSVTDLPVTAVGRIVSSEMAQETILNGTANLVALGRQLIADPDWPRKVAAGLEQTIRPCIMCNRGCTDNIMHRKFIECTVNPTSGLEEDYKPAQAENNKAVLVIGGGVSGMQASLAFAQAGCDVTLMEQADQLGGQLILAARPPGKEEVKPFLDHLVQTVESMPIKLALNTSFDEKFLENYKDSRIVVATGASPIVIPIPGVDSPNAHTAWDILKGKTPVAKEAVVIGAGSVGIETALYMANQGAQVSVVEIADKLLPTEVLTLKPRIIQELEDHRVDVLLEHAVTRFDDPDLTIKNLKSGKTFARKTGQLVLAVGARPDKSVQSMLDAQGIDYTEIGDCSGDRVGLIGDAVRAGYFVI